MGSSNSLTRAGWGLTWSLMRFPPSSMFLILKSMPIVVMKVGEKESLAYLRSRQVLPTPVASKHTRKEQR